MNNQDYKTWENILEDEKHNSHQVGHEALEAQYYYMEEWDARNNKELT